MQPLLLNTTRFSAEDTAKGAPESRERHSRIPRRIPKEIQTKYSSTLPGDPTPEGLSCACSYILIRIYVFLILRHQQLVQLVQYFSPIWLTGLNKEEGDMKKKEMIAEQLLPPHPHWPRSCDCCPAATWALRQLPHRGLDSCHIPSCHGAQAGWNVGMCVCVCARVPYMIMVLPDLIRSTCIYLGLILGFLHLHLVLE